MKLNAFMSIAAFLALFFGVAFLLAPTQLMSLYGVDLLEPGGVWAGRYLGTAFLGIGVLTWLARNAVQGISFRAIMIGYFVASITGFTVAVLDGLDGVGNALIWLTVALYLFLTLGFGYFIFIKPVEP